MTTTDQPMTQSSPTARTDELVGAVASLLSAALGQVVDAGPADAQGDPSELVPEGPGWATAAEVHGDLAAASVLVCADVADELGADGAWTAVLDGALETWGAGIGTAVGTLTPPSPSSSIGALLPTGPGYQLIAGGLFLGDRHVGTVAVVARPPAAPAGGAATAPGAAAGAATGAPVHAAGPLQALAEVQMSVTAELGRCRMSVQDLLGLVPGAVVELDRSAGSPIDLLVNGTLIARGEVVVVDEEFGLRLTEIVGPED